MIDTPQISQSAACETAVIRLTILRGQIQNEMGPAIGELMSALRPRASHPWGLCFLVTSGWTRRCSISKLVCR
jgi:hypothetical protein